MTPHSQRTSLSMRVACSGGTVFQQNSLWCSDRMSSLGSKTLHYILHLVFERAHVIQLNPQLNEDCIVMYWSHTSQIFVVFCTKPSYKRYYCNNTIGTTVFDLACESFFPAEGGCRPSEPLCKVIFENEQQEPATPNKPPGTGGRRRSLVSSEPQHVTLIVFGIGMVNRTHLEADIGGLTMEAELKKIHGSFTLKEKMKGFYSFFFFLTIRLNLLSRGRNNLTSITHQSHSSADQ